MSVKYLLFSKHTHLSFDVIALHTHIMKVRIAYSEEEALTESLRLAMTWTEYAPGR